jgi:tRNA(Ile)-lysidine synthase
MLDKIIQEVVNQHNVKNVLVGFSGGVDSTVLIHLLSNIESLNVRAVYVDHGLSEHSQDWSSFCEKFCKDLNIEFFKVSVDCSKGNRESLESVARDKRYEVYKSLIDSNEHLCLGQHADDQTETVLLQLLRGTGLNGLSGMPEITTFENGFLLRPFLNNDKESVTKEMIESYAKENNIKHIVDESNYSNDYRRNFLRNNIIPELKNEFGNINKSIQRTAKNCAEAAKYINDKTLNLEGDIFHIKTLDNLDNFEIKNTLQKWIKNNKKQVLSSNKLNQLATFIKNYKLDSKFTLETKQYTIRQYNYEIYLLDKNYKKEYIQNNSSLGLIPIIDEAKIIYRKDIKDTLTFEGKPFNIKKFFNRLRLPLWERECIPIYVLNNEIISIANYQTSKTFKNNGKNFFSFEVKK